MLTRLTMRSWVVGTLVLLALPTPAWAWTAVYSWSPVPTATIYRIEKSVDNGVAWTVVTATLTAPTYTYTGSEAGLVLFRVSACNANGCTVRPADGLWHNEAWQVPGAPVN